MAYKFIKSDEASILIIEGEQTIEHAGELKLSLIELMSKGYQLYINIEKLTIVDISFFQLLCSAKKTSLKLKKSFELQGKWSNEFRQSIENNGYQFHTGCVEECNKACLLKEH